MMGDVSNPEPGFFFKQACWPGNARDVGYPHLARIPEFSSERTQLKLQKLFERHIGNYYRNE